MGVWTAGTGVGEGVGLALGLVLGEAIATGFDPARVRRVCRGGGAAWRPSGDQRLITAFNKLADASVWPTGDEPLILPVPRRRPSNSRARCRRRPILEYGP